MNSNILWEPAIYEHKAALIDRAAGDVACSAELLTEAILSEYEVYKPDFLTVGVDIYNIEAEACGAEVIPGNAGDCPEIRANILDLANLPSELDLPAVPASGRFGVMLEAGKRIQDKLGHLVSVRIAASGPTTIAAKLVGLQELIMGMALESDAASVILDFSIALAAKWCRCLRAEGLDVVVFDSVASPPMISPDMYTRIIQPLHTRLMSVLHKLGQDVRPLIIGGDTTLLVPMLIETGSNMVICDFNADAVEFAGLIPAGSQLQVRRNVNPGVLTKSEENLHDIVEQFVMDLRRFAKPVAGTGILPYDMNPEQFWLFRRLVESAV
ncbi:MAG: hypothetical protein K8S55_01210 [Phycisphaerae bacterium]|nr:hypothetical protein [Phycisphaerae bacterium]